MQKSKVVIDTNILISAFVFGGNIEKRQLKKLFLFVKSMFFQNYLENIEKFL